MSAIEKKLAADGLPEGWFFADDAKLYIQSVNEMPAGGRLVEIGTWLGRSLATIMPTAISRGVAVWAIDTWQGSPNDPTEAFVRKGLDAFAVCKANMECLGFWGSFTPVRDDHKVAAQRFPNETIDLIFLDADHRYEAVRGDILLWWPKLRPGGMFLGHDYGDIHPGVAKAVHELLGQPEEVSGYVWRVTKKAST